MNVEQMDMKIAKQIVTDALYRKYTVSVNDGEEWTVKRSSDFNQIIEALASTGEDLLKFRSESGEALGTVYLVWGNCGWDLITDHSANEVIAELLTGANELSDKYQEL